MEQHSHAPDQPRKRHKRERPPHPDALAYGVDEAAHVLGISRRSLYELIASGRLKSTKLCGRRIVPRASLERLLEEAAKA
ncbi:helix-turn-helix domain-containing protein [Thioalkalivibrio sp.]|uniref:helix-turn-helix domain-containing protein n=1 Tax=Thioalkalivibrio sp. TaxID=2093813 RepID=UPI003562AA28